MNWRSYQSYSTINRFLSCVASSSPLVTGYRAGRSLEGRDIMALKVSTGGDKPAIFIGQSQLQIVQIVTTDSDNLYKRQVGKDP